MNLNQKAYSEQRESSSIREIQDTKSGRSQSLISDYNKIILVIHANPKLEKIFMNEINPNIKIICGQKVFSLNKAYLRVESQFFQKIFEENENQQEITLDIERFNEKDVDSLEQVLRCLYGGKIEVLQKDLYQIYKICSELQIDKLVNILNEEILQKFSSFNFFSILQLGVIFNSYDLLNKSKEFLNLTSFDILKDKSSYIKKNLSSPQTFVDLDYDSAQTILNYCSYSNFLSMIELFELIRIYCRNNPFTSDIVDLVQKYLPSQKLQSKEFQYILSCLNPEEQSVYIQQNKNLPLREQGSQESSILQLQLESENIYYQKKIQEMESIIKNLQEEMIKMKKEIEQKAEEFNLKEQQLELKLSDIQNSIKQFDTLDKDKECEFKRKMKKLFKMIKDKDSQLIEKDKQNQDLNQILRNFQFVQQQAPPPHLQQNVQQNQINKSSTHSGLNNRKFSLQNISQNKEIESQQMKKCESSGFITQNSIQYGEVQFQQSQLIPLSKLELSNCFSTNTLQQNNQNNQNQQQKQNEDINNDSNLMKNYKNLPNLMKNYKLIDIQNQITNTFFAMIGQTNLFNNEINTPNLTNNPNQINNDFMNIPNMMKNANLKNNNNMNIMNNLISITRENSLLDQSSLNNNKSGKNYQKQINESTQDQEECIQNITRFTQSEFDLEHSATLNHFTTFNEESKVLKDCCLDYQAILQGFFGLSPFKKMNLKLLYRSSRDGFTKESFDSQVCNISGTIVFIKSCEYNKIFGAYLSIPWSTELGYQPDDYAFLFSISHNKKIQIKNTQRALYQDNDYLFSFGTNDLSIVENGDTQEINQSDYPDEYQEVYVENDIPLNCLLAGSQYFQVQELEVFQVSLKEDMDF